MKSPDKPSPQAFAWLYAAFDEPVTDVDCGLKCAPYNERGVPFCCDPEHAIPTAYREEWDYLQRHTDLWRPWHHPDPKEEQRIRAETPAHQVPIVCKGVACCQRSYRSLVCRAFPFFPYISQQNELWGLSYYWQYEDRCWVLSHLHRVRPAFVQAALEAYRRLFRWYPQERENFAHHSRVMRRVFARRRRGIPLFHRDGFVYLVDPRTETLHRVDPCTLPKHGVYRWAQELPFPDELDDAASSARLSAVTGQHPGPPSPREVPPEAPHRGG